MDKLPKLGEMYNCYDDGKICESRRYFVKIINIIPFGEAPQEMIDEWNERKSEYDWLYAKETDFFIIGDSYEQEEVTQQIFARTIDGKWFGLGAYWNCGLLKIE